MHSLSNQVLPTCPTETLSHHVFPFANSSSPLVAGEKEEGETRSCAVAWRVLAVYRWPSSKQDNDCTISLKNGRVSKRVPTLFPIKPCWQAVLSPRLLPHLASACQTENCTTSLLQPSLAMQRGQAAVAVAFRMDRAPDAPLLRVLSMAKCLFPSVTNLMSNCLPHLLAVGSHLNAWHRNITDFQVKVSNFRTDTMSDS